MFRNLSMTTSVRLSIWALCLLVAGCATTGPPTVTRDRFDYIVAISESWKRQTLLNLVKTRYVDAPVFMDIASIINQYTLESEVEFGFTWAQPNTQSIGGRGVYADRPTITYSPLMGEKYTRSILKPMPISAIVLLLQSGYPADSVLRVCVQSINSLKNWRSGAAGWREADPEFEEVLTLFRDLQTSGRLLFRIESKDGKYSFKLSFRPGTGIDLDDKAQRIYELLGLDTTIREFRTVFGHSAKGVKEIAILSRSLAQIMAEYASFISVPQSDIDEGRVLPTRTSAKGGFLVRVKTGTEQPDDAYAAVPYRDHWFWIEDTDLHSKTAMQFLMVLFSLTERGAGENLAPVITVPTY